MKPVTLTTSQRLELECSEALRQIAACLRELARINSELVLYRDEPTKENPCEREVKPSLTPTA